MIETAFFHAEMVSTENFFHDVNTDRFFCSARWKILCNYTPYRGGVCTSRLVCLSNVELSQYYQTTKDAT